MAKKRSRKKKKSSMQEPMAHAPMMFDPSMFNRDLLKEGRQALQLMDEAYPRILATQQKYGKDFARTEVGIGEARGVAEAEAVGRSGGLMRESILKSSPEIAAANKAMMDRLGELGPSAIEREMNKQALEDLKLGGALSGEDVRLSSQSARAAMQARGLNGGRSAAVAEVLNRQTLADGRRNERRGFASGVDAQTQQRKAGDAAISNNTFNTLGAFWDPQQRLFGRGGSQVSGQISGPGSYFPFLGAAQDVGQGNQQTQLGILGMNQQAQQFEMNRQDSNYWSMMNMRASDRNAAANRSSATTNAWIGAAGGAAGLAALAFLL